MHIQLDHENFARHNHQFGLFQVWVDRNCGFSEQDWSWNSAPKKLGAALDEAADCRARGFPTKILPEGMNPRPDGRWDE